MRKYLCLILCLTSFFFSSFGQSQINQFLKPSDTLNIKRRNAVVISETSVAALTLVGLNQLWYVDFERSKFKTLNDSNEWQQMDKLGHVYSAYQLTKLGANTMNWAGVSQKNQLIFGASLSFSFLTAVEVFDGFSEEWGFSWADMFANAAGTGLFIGQELLWKEQRVQLKFSFNRTDFAPQHPEKLGNGVLEEILKDYNGQTYWLSANLSSFFKGSKIPKWFNVAFGYGANGMLTGTDDSPLFLNQKRTQQYYLSFDIDLTRIKTKSHVLKTIFDVFNVIKVPSPTLELNSEGRLKLHYIYF